MHTILTWHPLRANPLDYVGRQDLVTKDGRMVEIAQKMAGGFVVTIDGQPFPTGSNLNTCAYLDRNEVGLSSLHHKGN